MVKHIFILFLVISIFQACSEAPSTTSSAPSVVAPPEPSKPAAYASAKEGWLVDLDEAYAVSSKSGKPILANFTGSDWCGWCKKLDADVFTKPEFKEWANENVVLLELDFPRRFQIPEKNRGQNASMQQALQVTGFPTVWALKLTKDEATGQYRIDGLGKTGYTPTAEQFIATVDKFVNP